MRLLEELRPQTPSSAYWFWLKMGRVISRNILCNMPHKICPRAEKPKAAQRYAYFWEIRRATCHKKMDKKDTQNKIRCPSQKNPFPQRQEIDLIFRRLTEREEEAWKNALFFVSLQSLLSLE